MTHKDPLYYQLGVVGDPIEHSLSPFIHRQFAQQFSLDINYLKLKPDTDFEQLVRDCQQQGYQGLNVTAPFKQAAFQLADTLGPQAQKAQAVNTLTFKAGHIHGENTDGEGLVRALTYHHHYQIQGSNLLILGAGGAARGILPAVCNAQPRHITIANRTPAKAEQLADLIPETINWHITDLDSALHLSIDSSQTDNQPLSPQNFHDLSTQSSQSLAHSSESFPHTCSSFLRSPSSFPRRRESSLQNTLSNYTKQAVNIIIDTTSDLQHKPSLLNQINCSPSLLWYDLKYHHHPTWLKSWLEQNHCQFANGLSMLIEQAAISFAIWTGYKPDTLAVGQPFRHY